jgi:hypothetical protein
MGHSEDFAVVLPALQAIASADVESPDIPADAAAQEAEDLYKWALQDKAALEGGGLSWELVESLPVRAGALHEAESLWVAAMGKQKEPLQEWVDKSQNMYDLRSRLMHAFRYAYSDTPLVLGQLKHVDRGTTHHDMAQDLNDLAKIGLANPDQLAAVKFDMGLLQAASAESDGANDLLSTARATQRTSEAKELRDRAFSYLKQAVTKVRQCGQYVFWRDADRAAGYSSDYLRRKRNQQQPEEAAEPAATPAAS